MFTRLDPARIIASLEQLEARILERFPGAGLARVCAELTRIARHAHQRSEEIARPNSWLRLAVALALAAGCVGLGFVVRHILASTKASDEFFGTLQGIDAGINITILMGAALFFLVSLEDRMKRRRALAALHELRSIIHVIDMHQLTKDPSADVSISAQTPSSPKRTLTRFELERYLDYCSEMLSLTAKVAVVYAQSFPDPVVTEAVNDLERTSTGLAQKIWAKINILHRDGEAGERAAGGVKRESATAVAQPQRPAVDVEVTRAAPVSKPAE